MTDAVVLKRQESGCLGGARLDSDAPGVDDHLPALLAFANPRIWDFRCLTLADGGRSPVGLGREDVGNGTMGQHANRAVSTEAWRLMSETMESHGADADLVAAAACDAAWDKGLVDDVLLWRQVLRALDELAAAVPPAGLQHSQN